MSKFSKPTVSASSSDMSSLSSFSTNSFTNFSATAMNYSVITDLKTFLCSKCNRYYDIFLRNNMYVGRVPLILHCNHTMCEECIRATFSKREIACAECQKPSLIDENEKRKIQELFPVNFYLMGIIYYSKPNMSEVAQLNLKPAGVSYRNRTRAGSSPSLANEVPDFSSKGSSPSQKMLQEKCSQANCSKAATLRCADCDELYCETCCQTLHKAARGLQTHKITPISGDVAPEVTEKCAVHKESPLEFHCNTCTKLLCCYCVLQGHSGHEYYQLTHLNESDRANFEALIESAEEKLKKLLLAYKKVKWEITQNLASTPTTAIDTTLAKYFTNIHAKLQCIEKKMRKDASKAKGTNLYILNDLSKELASNIRNLNILIGSAKNVNNPEPAVKFNVKLIIERLETALNLPCYFVGEQPNLDNIRFVCGDILDNLENHFSIDDTDSSSGYQLVNEKELPEGYDTTLPNDILLLDLSDLTALETNDISPSLAVGYKSAKDPTASEMLTNAIKPKPTAVKSNTIEGWIANAADITKSVNDIPLLRTDDRENVIVTHIDTPECFYVQLTRFNGHLQSFSKEIEIYVQKFAPSVTEPELNKLYIVKYDSKERISEWYRGRVIDIIDEAGETVYNILFIDYGNTQVVKINKLREINSTLAKPKPFALQCKLFNLYPVLQDWDRKAMFLMAQIITGTDVIMVVMNNSDGILEVDLIAVSGGDMASIRDALIFVGYAVSCPNTTTPIVDLKMKSVKPMPKLHKRTENFKKEQETEIVISHVVDPHNIYVHIADYLYHIEHLNELMKRYYNSKPNKGQIFGQAKGDNIYVPRKGMIVAVRNTDIEGVWCRGTVMDIVEGQGMVNVFLVDYGKNMIISYTQIRKLPERFRNLDCQAMLVKMSSIKPTGEHETWEQNAIEFINNYCINKSKLFLKAIECKKPVEVALFERYASMDICINALMVREGLAISTGKVSEKVTWTKEEPSAAKKENTYVSDLLNTIQCSKKTNVDSSSDVEEETEMQKVVRIPIRVLLTKNPDLIYVSVLSEATQKVQHELHLALQNFYGKQQLEAKVWEVNDICVVLDCKKKHYFRAVILEKIDDLNYKVILRDIAEEIIVSKRNIGILQSQFKQFNEGAVRCHLAGVIPAGDTSKWSGLAIEFLQDVFEKNFNVYMTKNGPTDINRRSLPVTMWYSEFKPGAALEPSRTILHDINKLLIKNGLALKERTVQSDLSANSKTEDDEEKKPDAIPLMTPEKSVSVEKMPKEEGTSKAESEPTKETQKDITPVTPVNEVDDNSKHESSVTQIEDESSSKMTKIIKELFTAVQTAGSVHENKIQKSLSSKQFINKSKSEEYVLLKRPKSTELLQTSQSDTDQHIPLSLNSSPVHLKMQDTPTQITEDKSDINNIKTVSNWNEIIELDEAVATTSTVDDPSIITDWLPAEPFTERSFEAFATFVNDKAHIYLHEADLEPVLKGMEEKMKAFFDKTPPEPEGTIWVPGQLCTVKYFVNESWYRGKIVNVTEEFIKVLMVDYGNEEECKHEDLRFKVMYMDFPSFTNKVQLYRVFPRMGSKWLTSDLDELHKKVVENKIFVILKGHCKQNYVVPAIVRLDGININDFMIENSKNLVSYKQHVVEEIETDSDVIIEDEQSDDPTDVEEASSDISNSYSQFSSFMQKSLPASLIGQKINVTVTSIISYNQFIFEILNNQDIDEVKKLFDGISADIRSNADKQPILYDIKVGQACVTKFSEDGEWYRGEVSNIDNAKSGVVEIWFVDFGNTENVPRDTVRAMRPDWLKLPVLQYKGEVAGIELSDPSCLSIVIEYMAEFCNTIKSAEIVSINPLRVRLYNDNDALAYQDLIDQHLLISTNSELS